jgi:ankyrin repeat protein
MTMMIKTEGGEELRGDFNFKCDICLGKPNPDFRDAHVNTPIHHAAQQNHCGCMKELVEVQKCNINAQSNSGGFTSCYICAQYNHHDALKYLLDHKADPNITCDNGTSPAGIAAAAGNFACLQYLIDANADVNKENSNDQSPLQLAIAAGKPDTVELLLNNGAKYNGIKILMQAVIAGHVSVVKVLCLKQVSNVAECVDDDDFSLIHNAAQRGHTSVVQYLVEQQGVDMNTVDPENTTPAFFASFFGHEKTLQYLIDILADINMKDEDGRSPLWVAAQRGRLQCLKALVIEGANIDEAKLGEKTILDVAMENKNMDCVRFLFQLKEENKSVEQFTEFALDTISTEYVDYNQPRNKEMTSVDELNNHLQRKKHLGI